MTGVSETGMITSSGREGFSLGFMEKRSGGPTPPPSTQPILQNNMRLAYTSDATAAYNPLTSPSSSAGGQGGGGASPPPAAGGGIIMVNMENNSGGVDGMKRKRGRPRKYGPDGSISLALLPNPPHSVSLIHPSSAEAASAIAVAPSPSLASGGSMVSPTSIKKARGRPPGSTNKIKKHQLQALGSAGIGFTPHVITVKTGEDVLSKVMSFSQHGPRAVCILSANGAISNVTLRQPATSGGTVTYEGRFEILSLSGSFLHSENGGQRSRTGGLSVSLSGPDGRVLGGGVAGLLTAAAPVQVIVGSFVADGRKESKLAKQVDPLSVTTRVAPTVGMTGASSPPSRGTLSESSGGPASPLNMSAAGCNNGNPPQGIASMPWK